MKRIDKYPETSSFIYFNANPKNRITGDCTFRAISLALNEDYNSTIMNMAKVACETGYAINDHKGIDRYMKKKGWIKRSQPRKCNNLKYTGKQFCAYLSSNYPNGELGNIVANIGSHHIVCIKPTDHGDGINCRYKIHDTWDSSDGCIGNWYTVE